LGLLQVFLKKNLKTLYKLAFLSPSL
jgi:hypothetical protein